MPKTCGQEHTTEAFETLLAPILGAAYGTAFHMTHNRDEAEDLVQDAAVQAFHAFGSFQLGTNFKAWFFQIMLNQFRKKWRKQKREPQTTPIDDAPDLYMFTQTANAGLQASNANPAALIISKMSEEQIRAAIASLPEEYRIVSVLYFMEEISYQEIADITGCPLGTVRSRLHRGRKLLQKALWQIAEEHHVLATLEAE